MTSKKGKNRPEDATPKETTADLLQETIESLEPQLEEANRERGQFKALLQRVQADFQNYKHRAEEEREELQQRASADIILKLLPILDDFSIAFDHVGANNEEEQSWREGFSLIYRKLWSMLEAEGVSTIEAQGKPFDPWEHEALGQEETTEHPAGTVVRVIRAGYKLRDRVLCPAQVIVAKPPESQETSDGSNLEEEQ